MATINAIQSDLETLERENSILRGMAEDLLKAKAVLEEKSQNLVQKDVRLLLACPLSGRAGSRPAGGLDNGVAAAGCERGGREYGERGEGGGGGRSPWMGQV